MDPLLTLKLYRTLMAIPEASFSRDLLSAKCQVVCSSASQQQTDSRESLQRSNLCMSLGESVGSLAELETTSVFRSSVGDGVILVMRNTETAHKNYFSSDVQTATELFTRDEIPRGPLSMGPVRHRASCVLGLAILSEEAMWVALMAWPHPTCNPEQSLPQARSSEAPARAWVWRAPGGPAFP